MIGGHTQLGRSIGAVVCSQASGARTTGAACSQRELPCPACCSEQLAAPHAAWTGLQRMQPQNLRPSLCGTRSRVCLPTIVRHVHSNHLPSLKTYVHLLPVVPSHPQTWACRQRRWRRRMTSLSAARCPRPSLPPPSQTRPSRRVLQPLLSSSLPLLPATDGAAAGAAAPLPVPPPLLRPCISDVACLRCMRHMARRLGPPTRQRLHDPHSPTSGLRRSRCACC